ncbi:hypothetical protein D8674_014044 [Pyrus ussuriensis x Pyrus communis]|uniref:Retrotransposon Copia-like N-terminal domain-containing protein n=1 Tax=Pyrus ussuriensis x Pyrus communis TaxID=2448454 RepID=A0A5N5GRF8_9ROSA|nr:hypothetical protein D8674_014044 [Pyrus ussuriensis x Pyrus communis]
MLNLNKLDFTALEVSGRNYLKWVQDVKLHLTAKSLRATIEEPTDDLVDEAQKATAMIFIHNALHTKLLWSTALITRKTFTCLKQDTTGSIYASKTLSL